MNSNPWDCPQTSWVERSVLVFSNLFYLAPLIHCLYVLCNRSKHFHNSCVAAATADAATAASSSSSSSSLSPSWSICCTSTQHNSDLDDQHLELDLHKALSTPDTDYTRVPSGKLSWVGDRCDRCDRCECRCRCGACGDHEECDGKAWILAILMLLPEMICSIAVFVISTVYHMCSDGRRCTQLCLMQWDSLYKADFTAAFQLMCVALLYTRHVRMVVWKWTALIICLCFNSLFASYVLDPPQKNQPWMPVGEYYGIIAAVCAGLILLRVCVQGYKIVFLELKQFRKIYAMLALVAATVGIYFQLAARSPTDPEGLPSYWWMHSLWHTGTGLATLFRFLMIPPHGSPAPPGAPVSV
jgi:hypothetical protein